MTRPSDAGQAARLGAAYVGVIFAESPRRVDVATARAVFEAAGDDVAHVAVFGREDPRAIAATAAEASADVVQLHGDQGPADIAAVRADFGGRIWAVLSIEAGSKSLPLNAADLADAADALVLDTRLRGVSGGTGFRLDWDRLQEGVEPLRERAQLILAGGFTAENVAVAMNALRPDVVDVSSGVEISPGVKDLHRMVAFAEAVRAASIVGRTTTLPQR